MAKNLKLTIKNTQIAKAVNLSGLKEKLANKKAAEEEEIPSKTAQTKSSPQKSAPKQDPQAASSTEIKEEAPRIRARSKSAFAEPTQQEVKSRIQSQEESSSETVLEVPADTSEETTEEKKEMRTGRRKTSEELRKEIFGEEIEAQEREKTASSKNNLLSAQTEPVQAHTPPPAARAEELPTAKSPARPSIAEARMPPKLSLPEATQSPASRMTPSQPSQRLGPTGRHVNDLYQRPQTKDTRGPAAPPAVAQGEDESEKAKNKAKVKTRGREETAEAAATEDQKDKKGLKTAKFKEFKDIKPVIKRQEQRFDGRDRQGLRDGEEDQHWRKKRAAKQRQMQEDVTIRPTSLKVRIPISIKDLASEMKLKASQLIAKLFSQGVVATLNDLLEDETTIQLLGQEFGCEISIDTAEEDRLRITDKSIKEEVNAANPEHLKIRPPVVAFMGHVDHGKTSLIDAIRKSNRAAGEAGAITQHIGAFRCSTPVGDIAILDTPGHEAFSAMRARGADATDIVVLVIAGDEGMRQQTLEAMNQAKAAKVTIVVAINKSDKPNFNAENVYRQLSEQELLPEVWGGQTITVNCSAVTGEGIPQLLEMLALQAEILELKSDPTCRARGTVLESEMHKGMGSVATVLVQNGTLRIGDSLVFGPLWGRVKTMHDEYRRDLQEAGPSTPVEITGLSGLPEAGQEFIVVKNEKEAREIADARMLGMRQVNLLQAKKLSMDNMLLQAAETTKKVLNIVLRADVQGSLEALKVALMKIESAKAELSIIFTGVGEVSESDVQLAATSKAVVIGFHTQIESHAEVLQKQLGVQVKLHNIIYHAVDDVKAIMRSLLDKIAIETDKGKAEVKATFKSSQFGIIAGCIVTEGSVHRNHLVRLKRGKDIVWKGSILSLKRVKEDVREVSKGLECGIVLNNFNEAQEGDLLEFYEVTYIEQEL